MRALDGIRGIAVILVLLFHLEVAGFAAGFLGVDLFFVLSGFLITSLLLTDIQRHGRVSLSAFWARRVRRLAPALVLVLLTVAAVTWLTASPIERESVRGDLLASSAYMANWRLISTSSYFESNGFESPVQHFWSLAIEEQFYLIWPLVIAAVLLVVRSRRLAVALPAVLAGSVSIVLLALLWRAAAPERAYEGTDARIFEPLIGALGAVILTTEIGRRVVRRAGTPLAVAALAGLAVALATSPSRRLALLPWWRGGGVALDPGPRRSDLDRRGRRHPTRLRMASVGLDRDDLLRDLPLALADRRLAGGARGEEGWSRVTSAALVVVVTLVVSTLSFRLVEQPVRFQDDGAAVIIGTTSSGSGASSWRRCPSPWSPWRRVCHRRHGRTADRRADAGGHAHGRLRPADLEVAWEGAAMDEGWRLVSAAFVGCPVSGERPTNARG